MKLNPIMLTVILILVMIVVLFLFLFNSTEIDIDEMNANIQADIKLNMSEDRVISLLGPGEYIEGFGGHGRKYTDEGYFIGISGDSDDDMYGNVSSIEIRNTKSSVFGIKIGDNINSSIEKLNEYSFKKIESNIFMNGEFGISLIGNTTIEYIQVWFQDKDLKDRVY